MKTNSIFILLSLLTILIMSGRDDRVSADKAEEVTLSTSSMAPSAMAPKNRWLIGYPCPNAELTYCCCDDGNSRVCLLPAMAFYCPAGGFIECTSDLRDCEGIQAECVNCCPPCMA